MRFNINEDNIQIIPENDRDVFRLGRFFQKYMDDTTYRIYYDQSGNHVTKLELKQSNFANKVLPFLGGYK